MYLKDLKLWNFRSYEQLDLSFSEGITILTGENGQGKTNVIEAVYFLLVLFYMGGKYIINVF